MQDNDEVQHDNNHDEQHNSPAQDYNNYYFFQNFVMN